MLTKNLLQLSKRTEIQINKLPNVSNNPNFSLNQNRGFMSPQPRNSKIGSDFSSFHNNIWSPNKNNLTSKKNKINTPMISQNKGRSPDLNVLINFRWSKWFIYETIKFL